MSPLLEAGLNITAIGMGVVFVLLTLMVFIIRGMSALAMRIAPPAAPAQGASQPGQPAQSLQETELVSVISAAVTTHRQRRH
jgi:oxaloacetate decarboxylase (Na+ extruding) subunit gamma